MVGGSPEGWDDPGVVDGPDGPEMPDMPDVLDVPDVLDMGGDPGEVETCPGVS
jgi:hypothetical protein